MHQEVKGSAAHMSRRSLRPITRRVTALSSPISSLSETRKLSDLHCTLLRHETLPSSSTLNLPARNFGTEFRKHCSTFVSPRHKTVMYADL